MPVFTFRLQVLLDQKLELQKQARAAVSEKERLLNEAKRALDELREKEREIQKQFREISSRLLVDGQVNQVLAVQRKNNYREGLAGDLKDAREAALAQKFVVEEAEEELTQAQTYAAQCSREVEKLEKYRDKQEVRFRAEAERKEQLEQDELGIVMYLSGRDGK
jgi:phosphomevalonate kinase